MNDQDILLQICSKMNNNSLEILSRTSLWLIIREFSSSQYFWYLRTQHLSGRELKRRTDAGLSWKKIYYSVRRASIRVDKKKNPWSDGALTDRYSMEVLLELGYDPSVPYAIIGACDLGCIEVVKLLLSDSRVILEGDIASESIVGATTGGHLEVVKFLLADPRVDPSLDSRCVDHPCSSGYIEVVRLLLADPRINSSEDLNEGMISASRNGYLEIVKLLLSDKRVDPFSDSFFGSAIELAAKKGHAEIVKLIVLERMEISDETAHAIRRSLEYSEIMEIPLSFGSKKFSLQLNMNGPSSISPSLPNQIGYLSEGDSSSSSDISND